MKSRYALLAALAFHCQAAVAEVYSWREPLTGDKRFSNVAPAWYTIYDAVRGPRVVVTRNGKLIDDTALPLERRRELLNPTRSDRTGRPRS